MALGKLEEVMAWSDGRGQLHKSKEEAIFAELNIKLLDVNRYGTFVLRENDILKPQFRKEIIELLEMLDEEE